MSDPITKEAAAASAIVRVVQQIEALRDHDLRRHESSVGRICATLGHAIGIGPFMMTPLTLAAELHDVGKLAISDLLLNKTAKLTDDEMAVIRTHSQIGYDILTAMADPALELAGTIALGHHELYDGSGYPRGLCGEAIPVECRIMTLCDVYDALRADRPYRRGMSHDEAVAIMTAEDGRASRKCYDPAILDAFTRHGREIEANYAMPGAGSPATLP